MKATKPSVNWWMDIENLVCIHSGTLFTHKKNKLLPFAATSVNLEGIMVSKMSEAQRDKDCVISFICVIIQE